MDRLKWILYGVCVCARAQNRVLKRNPNRISYIYSQWAYKLNPLQMMTDTPIFKIHFKLRCEIGKKNHFKDCGDRIFTRICAYNSLMFESLCESALSLFSS